LLLTSSLTSSSSSPFFNIPWVRVNWLFFRLALCLILSRSLGCLVIFWLSFEHFWPPLMQSSLPAWLPQELSDLSGLEPGSLLEI
jgi:hypothetical protein